MFRIWIVLTIIYAVCGVIVSMSYFQLPDKVFVLIKPGMDLHVLDNPYGRYSLSSSHKTLYFKDNVFLLVHNSVPFDPVEANREKYEATWTEERQKLKWDMLPGHALATLAAIVLPPLIILALGAAIGWAFSGFRRAT